MTSPAAAPRIPGSSGSSAEWLVESLAGGLDESRLVVAWLPCPLTDPDRAFALAPRVSRMAWIGTDGGVTVGAGVAIELRASGDQRFLQMQNQIENAYASLVVLAEEGAEALDPRFYGGFAFHSGSANQVPWSDLGDARFVLPRLLFRQQRDHAQVGLAVSRQSLVARPLRQQVQDLIDWRASLQSATPTTLPAAAEQVRTESSPGNLRERIERAVAATSTGHLDKVVVADCQLLELVPPPDPAMTLSCLLREAPTATIFAFETTGSCFLGASPERLVLRQGREVNSEALAGSISLAPSLDTGKLLESAKDRSEHAFVVRAIRDALTPLCSDIQVPSDPALRRLRRVAHLSTPIVGHLNTSLHVLQLVSRLHPTPAVAGSPSNAAMGWIRENEPQPRGWYAAPVGWVDSKGDGDFVVALRSGVLWGDHAMLFAGAGIVRGSTPDTEVAEVDLKLATFRSAIGVSSR